MEYGARCASVATRSETLVIKIMVAAGYLFANDGQQEAMVSEILFSIWVRVQQGQHSVA